MKYQTRIHHAAPVFNHARRIAQQERSRRSPTLRLISDYCGLAKSRESHPAEHIQQMAKALAQKMSVFSDWPRGEI